MSLLRRLTEPRRVESRSAGDIPSNSEIGTVSPLGFVTADQAMRLSAWWAAVNLVANLPASMPWHGYTLSADGVSERLADDPTIVATPSTMVTSGQWKRQTLVSALTRGNTYGWVTSFERDRGEVRPSQIEILNPDIVQAQCTAGRWEWRVNGALEERYPVGRLWHLAAYTPPGCPVGLSPVAHAAQAIGLGLSAERFGTDWFQHGSHPSAVLSTEMDIDEGAAKALKERFKAAVANREVAVLGGGTKYEAIQIAPNESQFLETIKANVATIARIFNVPPEMIGGESGGSLTYANVEQRALDLLRYSIGPWVKWLEDALSELCPSGVYVKASTDAMLRLDQLTAVKVAETEIRLGTMSRNEYRRLKDRPPIDGGDQTLWPPHRQIIVPADLLGDEEDQ